MGLCQNTGNATNGGVFSIGVPFRQDQKSTFQTSHAHAQKPTPKVGLLSKWLGDQGLLAISEMHNVAPRKTTWSQTLVPSNQPGPYLLPSEPVSSLIMEARQTSDKIVRMELLGGLKSRIKGINVCSIIMCAVVYPLTLGYPLVLSVTQILAKHCLVNRQAVS